MTPLQFRKHLDRLRLTQSDFARLIKVPPRGVRRYTSGDSPIRQELALLVQRLQPDDPEVSAVRREVADKTRRAWARRPKRRLSVEA